MPNAVDPTESEIARFAVIEAIVLKNDRTFIEPVERRQRDAVLLQICRDLRGVEAYAHSIRCSDEYLEGQE